MCCWCVVNVLLSNGMQAGKNFAVMLLIVYTGKRTHSNTPAIHTSREGKRTHSNWRTHSIKSTHSNTPDYRLHRLPVDDTDCWDLVECVLLLECVLAQASCWRYWLLRSGRICSLIRCGFSYRLPVDETDCWDLVEYVLLLECVLLQASCWRYWFLRSGSVSPCFVSICEVGVGMSAMRRVEWELG